MGIYKYERRYIGDDYGNTDAIRISAFKRLNGLRRDRHETRVKFRLLAWRKYANDPWRTILVLVGSIIVSNSFIVFSNQDSRDFFTNWSINTGAAARVVDVYPNGNHSLQTQSRQIFCLYAHHFYCGIGLVVSCRTHLDLLSTCVGNWYSISVFCGCILVKRLWIFYLFYV